MIGYEPVMRRGLDQLMGKIEFVNYVDSENAEFREYAAILRRRLLEGRSRLDGKDILS